METPDAVYEAATDVLDTIEKPFYYLGLNTVPKRFLAGTAFTGAILYAVKPSSMYNANGSPKEFALTSSSTNSTYVPWWVFSLGVGVLLATFI